MSMLGDLRGKDRRNQRRTLKTFGIELDRDGNPLPPVDQAEADQVAPDASELAERLVTVTAAIATAERERSGVLADLADVQADRLAAALAGDPGRAAQLGDKAAELTSAADRLADQVAQLREAELTLSHEVQREEWSRQAAEHERERDAAMAETEAKAAQVVALVEALRMEVMAGRKAEWDCRQHAQAAAKLRAQLDFVPDPNNPNAAMFVPPDRTPRPMAAITERMPWLIDSLWDSGELLKIENRAIVAQAHAARIHPAFGGTNA